MPATPTPPHLHFAHLHVCVGGRLLAVPHQAARRQQPDAQQASRAQLQLLSQRPGHGLGQQRHHHALRPHLTKKGGGPSGGCVGESMYKPLSGSSTHPPPTTWFKARRHPALLKRRTAWWSLYGARKPCTPSLNPNPNPQTLLGPHQGIGQGVLQEGLQEGRHGARHTARLAQRGAQVKGKGNLRGVGGGGWEENNEMHHCQHKCRRDSLSVCACYRPQHESQAGAGAPAHSMMDPDVRRRGVGSPLALPRGAYGDAGNGCDGLDPPAALAAS